MALGNKNRIASFPVRPWLALVALVTGCAVESTPSVHQDTQVQPLGESSQAYWFSGVGAGEMPTKEERVAVHLMNRVRMAPYVWGVTDMDGNPIPPSAPLVYQPFFTEAGRWQGAHAIQYNCLCPQDSMAEPAAWNSCCELGYEDGQVKCVGPIVGCGDEGSTEQHVRWSLLNRGPGQIVSELYWNGQLDGPGPVPGEIGGAWVLQNILGSVLSARDNAVGVSQVNAPIVPDVCVPGVEFCEVGTCVDPLSGATSCDIETNDQCLGLCDGPEVSGASVPCVLPMPIDSATCDPATYSQAFYWTFSFGRGADPVPVLSDGIGFQLGISATQQSPNGVFGVTPEGSVEFSVNYFEPSGAPRMIQTVVRTQCVDMEPWPDAPVIEPRGAAAGPDAGPDAGADAGPDAGPGPDAGADAGPDAGADAGPTEPDQPYVGLTYVTQVSGLPQGCQRYFFTATDAEGFVTRYPTYGSLGISIDNAGNEVLYDPNCPIWAPEIPAATCLPPSDECNNGDTRPCYTGRDGTQDKGICAIGTETCENGRWKGVCTEEVRPEPEDTCADNLDNNCNGQVDEDCPVVVDPMPDMGATLDADADADTGISMDAGVSDSGTTPTQSSSDDDGGCSSVSASNSATTPILVLTGVLALVGLIRRR